jgi:anti-sigma factor RsiW
MTHEQMRLQVDAYLDGELAARESRELEAHLKRCSECSELRDQRTALSAALRRELPALQAPPELGSSIREAVRSAAGRPSLRVIAARPSWRRWALAASLALVALGSWRLGIRQAGDISLTDQLLASHVRSLMPGHLTDVLSSDQHTVKPWFNGKLDFSPPVYDLADRGYPLVGARIDYVAGRPVAALVYRRQGHLINVFEWPAGRTGADERTERAPVTRRGYHLLQWTDEGYVCWVVSDLGTAELNRFVDLLSDD